MQFIISSSWDGTCLRTYLKQELGLSARLLARLKQTERGMLLNQCPVTVRAIIHTGDRLCLAIEDRPSIQRLIPMKFPLHVLYADEDILLCDKPCGMPTHPSHGHLNDTLANAVAYYNDQQEHPQVVFRPVNRLDRDTSGVVLIARHQRAAAVLSGAMRSGQIHKKYIAVVHGKPPHSSGIIHTAIRRKNESIILREVCTASDEGAMDAITEYRVLHTWHTSQGEQSLVVASPITGRTHQLRVHFAYIGTPIVGDTLYGHADPIGIDRQALHAFSLQFPHPTTQQTMTICAPIPDDILALFPQAIRKQILSTDPNTYGGLL